VLEPEVLEWIPAGEVSDFGNDVFPALLRDEAALHAFTTMSYWNDVGGLDDLRRGSLDAVSGRVEVEIPGERLEPGIYAEDGCTIDATATLEGPLAIGRNVAIEGDAVVRGPCAIGAHSRIGVGAAIRSAVLLPGSVVPDDGLAIAGIFGDASSLASSVLRYPAGSTQTWL
jgi:NDP-sugar pyrophosphorylase family protein